MKFIITFGQVHTHRTNGFTFDKDSVGVIEANEHRAAHELAMDIFDEKFHNCISEEEYDDNGWKKYFPRGKYPANFPNDGSYPCE